MAISTSLTIKGYRITFTFFEDGFNGILLRPDVWDMDNPDFIDAIRIASEVYQDGEDFFSATNTYSLIEPHNAPDEDLAHCAELANRLLSTCRWPLRPVDIEKLLQAKLILETEIERRNKRLARPSQKKAPKRTAPGYVYLVQSPTTAYKIGRTVNPDDRISTFSVKLPFEVEYVAVIKTVDMIGLEHSLHQRFADKRVNGSEWFHLAPEDVEYIKSLAVQDE